MSIISYISVPVIDNFANLVIFPAKQDGASSIYIASYAALKPEVAQKTTKVEFLPDHVYCLLPSIKQDHGFGRLHTTMPDFVKNIPFWMFMGKVERVDLQGEESSLVMINENAKSYEFNKDQDKFQKRNMDHGDKIKDDFSDVTKHGKKITETERKRISNHIEFLEQYRTSKGAVLTHILGNKFISTNNYWPFRQNISDFVNIADISHPVLNTSIRLRGGADQDASAQLDSLSVLSKSVKTMVQKAIENAEHHGIHLYHGIPNMANGNCAFESVIDNISSRPCFREKIEGNPDDFRNIWMSKIENIAFDEWHGNLSREQWEAEFAILKKSRVYERELGDLIIPGIAHCTQKNILIFNTSNLAHSPIYVIPASTFGMPANTKIPVCLAYNNVHYEGLVPCTEDDVLKTVNLVQQYLQGEYKNTLEDIPIFCSNTISDYDIQFPPLNKNTKSRNNNFENKYCIKSSREEDKAVFPVPQTKIRKVSVNFDNHDTPEILDMVEKRKTICESNKEGEIHTSAVKDDKVELTGDKSDALIEIKSRMEKIKNIKAKDRTEAEKKELNRLRLKIFRQQRAEDEKEIVLVEREKDKKRNAEKRKSEAIRTARNAKETERKKTMRECENKKNVENEKDRERKKKSRENENTRRVENEKQKENKRKIIQEKRNTHRMIAVKVSQDKFQEKDIPSSIRSSYLGNLREDTNKCKHCNAYRFNNERNFCCGQGDIILPSFPDPPEELKKLFAEKKFTDNIRGYNNILAMASIGCETPESVRGPNFKIQGKVYHKIGSLLPAQRDNPKFLQLYFYDSDEATNIRMKIMPKLDAEILKKLTKIIEDNNSYIKSFKTALEYISGDDEMSLVLLADKKKIPHGDHKRRYSLPQGSEVAAIMPGEGEGELEVVVKSRDDRLTRIKCLHRSYDPLLYVVFDPYGTDGFALGLKRKKSGRNISLADFYSFRIQVRPGFNPLLRSKRCFQQYLVDQGAKIEAMRMKWVENHQKTIKAEKYNGLIDAAAVGDLAQVGRKIILPPTITGSPRFYVEKYQDCMAIVQKFGKPTLFITMTCNPEWKEIQEALNPGETAFDRPDICTRVFKLKNDLLLDEIEKKEIFGKVKAMVGTIEQQKRKGLHHSHNLIILESDYIPRNPEDIDRIVSAEIPDPKTNPDLYAIIAKNNMHGPCGRLKPSSPCMDINDSGVKYCTKDFPKELQKETTVTEYSYPKYRRRSPADGGQTVVKMVSGNPVILDNAYVVPYNSFLSLKFDCHINVEIVVSVVSVKYIYKYITKGPDRCIVKIHSNQDKTENNKETEAINEVENFLNARYLGASESVLKILKIPIHYRSHSVVKLACHLPGEQAVLFEEGQEGQALERGEPSTTLTAFFEKNMNDIPARNFLYTEFPGQFNYKKGKWTKKKVNLGKAIGRIPTVSLCAKQMETYSLRILLNHVRGPTCYDDLKTVNGVVMSTFQETCQKLGLLEDDSEIEESVREACSIRFGDQLVSFFGSILEFCRPGNPKGLWELFKKELSYHFIHISKLSTVEAENRVLSMLKTQLCRSGCTLKEFQLPEPNIDSVDSVASLIVAETSYDKENNLNNAAKSVKMMNEDQLDVFNHIIKSVTNSEGTIFCLNAAGGTGKTFILNALLNAVRGDGFVALATASSGVAAQLLPNGTTLHSRFKVPIAIKETSTCNFTCHDATGRLLTMTKMIIIDEMTMQHRFVYECIDRSLRDLMGNDRPFGGITVVFSGDWRQCLPIVKHGSRAEVVNACLRSSYLWKTIIVKNLIRNMRVEQMGECKEFSDLLLKIGDGDIVENEEMGDNIIKLPENFFIESSTGEALVEAIFPKFKDTFQNIPWIKSRAVLCPTNDECDYINRILLGKLPGEVHVYRSCDSVNDSEAHMYPQEFLNTIDLPGIPPHQLELKVGAVVILLRNLNPSEGHVNGTRYVIQNLLPHVIDVTAISGSKAGAKLFIPRIWLASKDPTLPFEMKRKQFPIRLAYSMTANKAQGQTLDRVGIYLGREFFSHGQFYVAISRVGNSQSVSISYKKENRYHVKNVVYKEVLK